MIPALIKRFLQLSVLFCAFTGVNGHAVAGLPVTGGSLTVGLESDLRGFDPLRLRVMGIATLTAAVTIYETLVELDDEGQIMPRLALSLEPSPDHRAWTAKLRQGVTFHDGTPFDAEAVVFHFTRLLDPENNCACRRLLAPLWRVEATDRYTVVFRLKQPWAALPAIIGEPSLVSLIGSPTAIRENGDGYHHQPVGTGPFMFSDWRAGDRLVVKRYQGYWRKDLPYLNKVVFRVLPDQQSRFASIRSGDVDIIWTQHARSVLRAEQDDKLRVVKRVGSGARILVLNTNVEPLNDRRVRLALAHALNMDLFAKSIYKGLSLKATDPYGAASLVKCDDTNYPVYDPVESKRLLSDYGRPVKLTFIHTATPRGLETGQVFQQFWKQVGIDVKLVPMEQVQLLRRVLNGDYQISAWRIRDSRDPDADLSALFDSMSPYNVTGYNKPEVDRLLGEGANRHALEARREAYCDLAAMINADSPILYSLQNTYFAIYRRWVKGDPGLQGGILDVTSLWVEK